METQTPTSRATDDRGTGEPGLLLIPGWCGDRSVFAGLLEAVARHRRTLSTDLRGQGEHDRDVEDFGTADVVDDLVGLLERAGVRRVVPVALSHAGWAAVELHRRLGADRVPGLVLLDWMVLGTPPGFTDALAGLQQPEAWRAVRSELFGRWTADVDTPRVHEYVASMGTYGASHWGRAGREIAAGFAAGAPLEVLAGSSAPPPTLHLYAQPADDDYLAAQQAFATHHPWFEVERLEARSHFPMLEVPEAMAARIEAFVSGLATPQ